MVVGTDDTQEVDRLFGALSNATRRDIVRRTLQAEYSVSQLARCYSSSFAAVQKHVVVLERAGLVTKRAQGREQLVHGEPAAIATVHELLDQLEADWRDRLDRFENTLNHTTADETGEGEPT